MNDLFDAITNAAVERRKQEIFEIESLWTRLSAMRGENANFRALDSYINDYFQAKYGRESLAFESIAEMKAHLESEIENAEKGFSAITVPGFDLSKPLLALSIRQPWAWAILSGGKDIENRDWTTNFRGTIAVHASKELSKDEISAFSFCAGDILSPEKWQEFSDLIESRKMPTGAILGTVEIADCIRKSDSPWFFGDFGFVLKNPKPLKSPIAIGGKLKFWEVPKDVRSQIFNQLGETK
jgi:hypothetical protein